MKVLPLLACLALIPAQARAQPEEASASSVDAPAAPADRDAVLADIDTWKHNELSFLTPDDPLTDEFTSRLTAIETALKTEPLSAKDLKKAKSDFLTWQHDLLAQKFAVTKGQGVTRGSLDAYSKNERARMSAVTAQTAAIAQARLHQTSAQMFDGGGSDGDAVGAGPGGRPRAAATGAPAPFGLHINDVKGPPAVTSTPLSLSSLWNYIDQSRGYKIAEAVFKRATGFAGYCYASVKEGFIAAKDKLWAKISSPTESARIGIPPGLAVDYQRAVNANPALLAKLGYRRVDVSTIPGNDPAVIPSGTILDFKPGCAGYSREAGHIEIIGARSMLADIPRGDRPGLETNQVLACSDGCHGRSLNYIRTYGRQSCMSMYVPVRDVASN